MQENPSSRLFPGAREGPGGSEGKGHLSRLSRAQRDSEAADLSFQLLLSFTGLQGKKKGKNPAKKVPSGRFLCFYRIQSGALDVFTFLVSNIIFLGIFCLPCTSTSQWIASHPHSTCVFQGSTSHSCLLSFLGSALEHRSSSLGSFCPLSSFSKGGSRGFPEALGSSRDRDKGYRRFVLAATSGVCCSRHAGRIPNPLSSGVPAPKGVPLIPSAFRGQVQCAFPKPRSSNSCCRDLPGITGTTLLW